MNFNNNKPFNKGGFKPKTIKDFTGSKPNRHKNNNNIVGGGRLMYEKPILVFNKANRFRTQEQIEADIETLKHTPMPIIGKSDDWRHITLGYYIHPNGIIFCADSKTILEQSPRDKNNPYLVVTLSYQGKGETHYVHRLVAAAFCKCPKGVDLVELYYNPEKWKVHHINLEKTDNRAKNLMWLDCTDHSKLHADLNNNKVHLNQIDTPKKIRAYINANYR